MRGIILIFSICMLGKLIAQPPSYGAIIERSLFQEELIFPMVMEGETFDPFSTIFVAEIKALELLSRFELEELNRTDLGLNSKYPASYISSIILEVQSRQSMEHVVPDSAEYKPITQFNQTLLNLPEEQQAKIGESIFSLKFIHKEWQILQARKEKGLKIDGKQEIDLLMNYLRVFEGFVMESRIERKGKAK